MKGGEPPGTLGPSKGLLGVMHPIRDQNFARQVEVHHPHRDLKAPKAVRGGGGATRIRPWGRGHTGQSGGAPSLRQSSPTLNRPNLTARSTYDGAGDPRGSGRAAPAGKQFFPR